MSREAEVVAYLGADNALMVILQGGIYADGAISPEGIRRGDRSPTNDAFDPATGFLLPCAVVKQRAPVPNYGLRDQSIQHTSISQVVEIYFYQDRGYDQIEAAKDRVYDLLEGYQLTSAFATSWILDVGPLPDVGPVKNSTTLRSDYQTVSIRKPSS